MRKTVVAPWVLTLTPGGWTRICADAWTGARSRSARSANSRARTEVAGRTNSCADRGVAFALAEIDVQPAAPCTDFTRKRH